MKFLANIGIFFGFILASIGLFVLFTAFSIYQGSSDFIEEINEPITQTINLTKNNVVISVPLEKEIGLSYESLDICKPKDKDIFFNPVSLNNSSYCCSNNHCTITSDDIISLDNAPKSFTVYHKDNNNCVQTKLLTKGHLGIVSYYATIEFTDDLRNKLHIEKSDYKVMSEKSSGSIVWKVIGTRKARFNYGKNIKEDILIVNDKKIATIVYSE